MREGPIEFDTVLDLCREQQRRIVLAVFADQQRPLTLNDLTKTIVKHNHHTPITEVSEPEVRQVQHSLYHVHVPKLEAAGVVEYDRERQLVEPTERFDELLPQLSAIIEAEPGVDTPVEL